jgi:hypothetical protein
VREHVQVIDGARAVLTARPIPSIAACREVWSAWIAMHATAPFSRADLSLAERLLGPGDPFVRTLRRHADAMLQLQVAFGELAASAATLPSMGRRAIPFVVASAVAGLVVLARAAARGLERRDAVWSLIAARGAGLPLRIVRRESDRLLAGGERERLARSFETLGDPGRPPACRAGLAVPAAEVRAELLGIAALLRRESPSVRGVAAARHLIGDGASSLFGRDAVRLREDLGRVAFLLR